MSVLDPVVASWDGLNRRIYLKQGLETWNWVDDLYKEYKNQRRIDESFRVWEPLLEAKGNDPKGGGKYTPRYVVLLDGTRVVPYDENILQTVTGEGITDDASDPFDTTTRVNPLKLYITPPAAEIVRDEVSLQAINRMSYNNGVTIDIVNGVDDPLNGLYGNEEYPCNTLPKAIAIAEDMGLTNLYIKESMTLDTGSDVTNYTITGRSHVLTELYVDTDLICPGLTIERSHVSGVLDGGTHINGCMVGDITYVNGHIHSSSLHGLIELSGNEDAVFVDCGVNDAKSLPLIDMGVSGQNAVFTDWSGGIKFQNLNSPTNQISIQIDGGVVTLLDTIVAGTVVITGIGSVIDQNGNPLVSGIWNGGVTIVNNAMSKENISVAVWDEPIENHLLAGSTGLALGIEQFDGCVTISTAGEAGTTFPLGTASHPVNNIPDAVAIATLRGISCLQFVTDFTIPIDTYIANFTLKGEGIQKTTLTSIDGAVMAYCQFQDCTVTGSVIGITGFTDCLMLSVGSNSPVIATQTVITTRCIYQGTVLMSANFEGRLYSIDCVGMPLNGLPPILDMAGGAFDLEMRNYSGFVTVKNCDDANDLRFMVSSGGVSLDSTVTAGDFIMSGVGTLNDNSTSVTSLDITSLVNQEQITKPNWDSIYIDTANGVTGIEFPLGTHTNPVSNLTDAKVIADREFIKHFDVDGDITLNDIFTGYNFEAISAGNCTIDLNNQDVENATFYHVGLTGICNGSIHGHECNISDVQNLKGALIDSAFMDTTPLVLSSGFTIFNNCLSAVAGGNSPIFDMSAGDIDLSIRSYSGGIRFVNSTSATNKTTVEFTAGKFNFDDSNTEGEFHIRGVVDTTDYDTDAGATVYLDGAINSDLVWDEVLTGATHNIPASAGRRMRNATSNIVLDGTVVSSTINTITLNGDSSIADGAYDPGIIAIVEGTGTGQARLILDYVGSTHTATVDRNWKVLPDATSEFIVTSDAGREHINEGLAQGGTINTITLNSSASDDNNTYLGQTIFIRSGLGEDQAHKIIAYDGTTHIATIYHDWNVVPDITSAYVMLPTGSLGLDIIENTVWNAEKANHLASGSAGEVLQIVEWLLGNNITKVDDIITIYEDDGVTIWKQYDLTNGGRVEV